MAGGSVVVSIEEPRAGRTRAGPAERNLQERRLEVSVGGHPWRKIVDSIPDTTRRWPLRSCGNLGSETFLLELLFSHCSMES